MGLQERYGSSIRKAFSKKGIFRCDDELLEKIQPGTFGVFQDPQPLLLMSEKKVFPLIELIPSDRELFAKRLDGRAMLKRFCQDTEDEKKAITGVGDDHVRKDRMSVATAFADQPKDGDLLNNRLSVDKVYDPASIISVDPAVRGRATHRTAFFFRGETLHVRVKQIFR